MVCGEWETQREEGAYVWQCGVGDVGDFCESVVPLAISVHLCSQRVCLNDTYSGEVRKYLFCFSLEVVTGSKCQFCPVKNCEYCKELGAKDLLMEACRECMKSWWNVKWVEWRRKSMRRWGMDWEGNACTVLNLFTPSCKDTLSYSCHKHTRRVSFNNLENKWEK